MDTNNNALEQFSNKRKETKKEMRENWSWRLVIFRGVFARRLISLGVLCTDNMANNESQLDEHAEEGTSIISITKSRLLPIVLCPAAAVADDDYCYCRTVCALDRYPMLS